MIKKKFPVLVIIPHGGIQIPPELEPYTAISKFELFMAADSCANDLFRFEPAAAVIDTHINRLFVDMNRSPLDLPSGLKDGVTSKHTPEGRDIYQDEIFPDEIAIANIIKRYHAPFNETVKKISLTDEIKLILECHTIPAVGQKNSPLYNKPSPVVRISNYAQINGRVRDTAPDIFASLLASAFEKELSGERTAAETSYLHTSEPHTGYIIRNASGRIPYLRIDITKGIFLNNDYFNPYYVKVDDIRINSLRNKIWKAIEKTIVKLGI